MASKKEFSDLLEDFIKANKMRRNFEGDSGLEDLEKIFAAMGYEASGFRFGSLIETFLSDNPGACEAIIEWLELQDVREWRESLQKALAA